MLQQNTPQTSRGWLATTRLVFLLSLLQVAATYPAILLGTYELVSSDDPDWTYDTYTQLADGTFSGWGTILWEGVPENYTYTGAITDYGCTQQSNGDVFTVSSNIWLDEDTPNEKLQECAYHSFIKAHAAAAVHTLHSVSADDEVSIETVSGKCPLSVSEAERLGIEWMEGGMDEDIDQSVWRCVKDCPATWDCSEASEINTMKDGNTIGTGVAPSADKSAAGQGSVPGSLLFGIILVQAFKLVSV